MKVPKSFKPEKNLEDKTKQLIEEAKILPKETQPILDPAVAYVLENVDKSSIIVSDTVDKLLLKHNYTNLAIYKNKPKSYSKYANYNHWCRPSESINGHSSVVSIRFKKYKRIYSYADIPDNNIDDYMINMDRFSYLDDVIKNKCKRPWYIWGDTTEDQYLECYIGGGASAILTAFIGSYAGLIGNILGFTIVGAAALGMGLTYFGRQGLSEYYLGKFKKEREDVINKTREICDILIIKDDRMALEHAFT